MAERRQMWQWKRRTRLIESLRTGVHGITIRLPKQLQLRREDVHSADLVDQEHDVTWSLFFAPDRLLDLRAEFRADLRHSLERHARGLFPRVRPPASAEGAPAGGAAGAPWSPLIDVDYERLGGTDVLRTTHRTVDEPGNEQVMGHLLVPARRGLFEARTLAVSHGTGYRESTLFAQWLRDHPKVSFEELEATRATFTRSFFDDARHDAAYPHHVLSRTRAALRWFADASVVDVREPLVLPPTRDVALPRLGCVLTPPPRFCLDANRVEQEQQCFHRVSFSATDRVEQLNVRRWWRSRSASDLASLAHTLAGELAVASGDPNRLFVNSEKPWPSADLPRHGIARATGRDEEGPVHAAVLCFVDEVREVWSLVRYGSDVVPHHELVADLVAVLRSFRRVTMPKEPRWR